MVMKLFGWDEMILSQVIVAKVIIVMFTLMDVFMKIELNISIKMDLVIMLIKRQLILVYLVIIHSILE